MGEDCCAKACSHSGPATNSIRSSDIWKACQVGEYELVKEFLDESPELVHKPGPIDQVPPLHWASLNGHLDVCRLLLERGASINQLGGDQWSTALHWAACRGQLGVASLLIQRGADYLTLRDQQGYLPIHIASQHGQTFTLLYLLAVSRNCSVDVTDLHGRTSLIWAAYRGHDETVKALLDEAAQVGIKDKSGSSALHWATIKGCAIVIRHLLKNGADPNEKDGDGKSSFDYAREKRWPWFSQLITEAGLTLPSVTANRIDLEAGTLIKPSSIKKRWLPEWFFRPIMEESLYFLFGRVFPPFITCLCFYLLAYSANFIVGMSLTIAVAVVCRSAYFVLLTKAIPADPRIPVMNTFHYVMNFASALVNVIVFVPSATSSPSISVSLTILVALASIGLFRVKTSDPGRIGKPQSDEERRALIYELADKDNFGPRSYCLTCRAGKPMRSKHCRTCGLCVAKFDHHCPWSNCCIGAANHRMFMFYLLAMSIGSLLYVKCAYSYFTNLIHIPSDYSGSAWPIKAFQWINLAYTSAPFVTLFSYVIASTGLAICLLTIFQLVNVARNRTTNEYSNSCRLEYLQTDYPVKIDEFGMVGNFISFFSGKQDPRWYSVSTNTESSSVVPMRAKMESARSVVIDVKAPLLDQKVQPILNQINTVEPNTIH